MKKFCPVIVVRSKEFPAVGWKSTRVSRVVSADLGQRYIEDFQPTAARSVSWRTAAAERPSDPVPLGCGGFVRRLSFGANEDPQSAGKPSWMPASLFLSKYFNSMHDEVGDARYATLWVLNELVRGSENHIFLFRAHLEI